VAFCNQGMVLNLGLTHGFYDFFSCFYQRKVFLDFWCLSHLDTQYSVHHLMGRIWYIVRSEVVRNTVTHRSVLLQMSDLVQCVLLQSVTRLLHCLLVGFGVDN
jgi:hypothetical protein